MIQQWIKNFSPKDSLPGDMVQFLKLHGHPKTAAHCHAVGKKAAEIARQFAADPIQAQTAGWLHDISAVIPNPERLEFARAHNLEILAEETAFPMLLHQKISVVLAQQIFNVTDPPILSAIGCHTTLKPQSSLLDRVVFLADKIAWDQPGQPPYLPELLAALETSLDNAILVYLDYLWEILATRGVRHPWFIQARNELYASSTAGSI